MAGGDRRVSHAVGLFLRQRGVRACLAAAQTNAGRAREALDTLVTIAPPAAATGTPTRASTSWRRRQPGTRRLPARARSDAGARFRAAEKRRVTAAPGARPASPRAAATTARDAGARGTGAARRPGRLRGAGDKAGLASALNSLGSVHGDQATLCRRAALPTVAHHQRGDWRSARACPRCSTTTASCSRTGATLRGRADARARSGASPRDRTIATGPPCR